MDKKEFIKNTAIDLFAETGYHKATMKALADTENIAVGSIYTYFNSKEDLINEILKTIL